MAAWHRQRRVLLRVSRAAWRQEQAGRERSWALASARAEGISIRALASAAGLSPARVHQITAAADMDERDAALGGLRAAGWPAPEDPGGDDDAEMDDRHLICDRLLDEADWLRQCAGWLTHRHTKGFPPAVSLRPEGDHPERAHVVAGLPRVAAILNRIGADVDELARARRAAGLRAGGSRRSSPVSRNSWRTLGRAQTTCRLPPCAAARLAAPTSAASPAESMKRTWSRSATSGRPPAASSNSRSRSRAAVAMSISPATVTTG